MKLNKYLLFMLILICSLINISGTNSPIEKRNLEPVNDGKRTLNEQTDNYIIIQFNKDVTYEGGKFLHKYNGNISYIMNGDEKIYPNSNFTAKNNIKLYVYFTQTIKSLESFFDVSQDGNLNYLISGDFCHFDTSSVKNMASMFAGCSSLQTLYLSNFATSSVTDMSSMFQKCSSLMTLNLSNFNTSSVTIM